MNRNVYILVFFLCLGFSCKQANTDSSSEGMTLRLELFTSDMVKSAKFYTQVLGFNMVGKKINTSYQPIKKGNVIIGIGPIHKLSQNHHFNPNLIPAHKGYGAEIVFEVTDIKEVYEHVKSSGYPIDGELTMQTWGLEDFRLIDPDGYYIRVTSK